MCSVAQFAARPGLRGVDLSGMTADDGDDLKALPYWAAAIPIIGFQLRSTASFGW
jgi:hypothetical protein